RKKSSDAVAAVERPRSWVFLTVPSPSSEGASIVHIPGRKFAGRLLDGAKQPMRDISLLARGGGIARAETPSDPSDPKIWLGDDGCLSVSDLQGQFELAISPQAGGISVFLPRGAVRMLLLPPGDGGDIVLEDRGHLRGRVGGADGSASVGAVRDGTHAFALQIPTSREGSFDLPDLDPSPFVLVAYADGRAPYVEPGITVGPGEEAEREVSLTLGGCLKVRFATREGAKAALEDGFLTFAGYDLGWLLRSVAPPTVTDAGKDG